jgi:demethylmenaquinone methyltransferase/2-methoxy-6-polyprenyl-1,4-benzoquinol methylase
VLGLDFAHEMLRVGREKVDRSGLAGIGLVRGDAMVLPVASATVDAVTMAFGIRNVFEPAKAVSEIHRVLKPGGRLAILEFSMPRTPGVRSVYRWYFRHVLPRVGRLVSRHSEAYTYLPASVGAFFSPAEFSDLVTGAGFSDVRAVPLTLGIVYMYTARK